MKHLRYFENLSDYEVSKDNLDLPNVAFVEDNQKVYYAGNSSNEGGDSDEPDKPEVDYSTQYLTFEALEDGTFAFISNSIQYSKDNGATWTSVASFEDINVVTGDRVMWKSTSTPGPVGIGKFYSSNNFNASGNIMSLLYGDDFIGQTSLKGKPYAFQDLFVNLGGLIDASNIILPATTLASGCYYGMFNSCYNMTTAPTLPATTLANECYMSMFNYCSSLNHITMLATDISASGCISYWVEGVASTGTFVKHPDMTSLPMGSDGIPSGWTVENYAEI